MSEGVEWTVHCCTLLAALPEGKNMTAARLAEFHAVPAPYLTKHLQALARAGILDSDSGPRGGFRLARPAPEITVLEVVEAIDGREPAFTCTEIRRRGPAGGLAASEYRKPCGIHALMDSADAAWRSELAATSVGDLALYVAATASPKAIERAAAWFQQVSVRERKTS